jgi:hypothetical protein
MAHPVWAWTSSAQRHSGRALAKGMNVLLAAYIPYDQSERYANGGHAHVLLWAAFGAIACLGLMLWLIWKTRREKRSR